MFAWVAHRGVGVGDVAILDAKVQMQRNDNLEVVSDRSKMRMDLETADAEFLPGARAVFHVFLHCCIFLAFFHVLCSQVLSWCMIASFLHGSLVPAWLPRSCMECVSHALQTLLGDKYITLGTEVHYHQQRQQHCSIPLVLTSIPFC